MTQVHDRIESIPSGKDRTTRRCLRLLALFATLVCALLIVGTPRQLRAQCGEPPTDVCSDTCCFTDALLLNTGYDHTKNGVYHNGNQDGYWTITKVDNAEYNASHSLPLPADVVKAAAGWGDVLTNSQWISATEDPDNSFPGDVTYEKCFCVCERSELTFDLDVLAPTGASVYFDGGLIASTDGSLFPTPTAISITKTVDPGRHCIEVVVHNDGGKAEGLDIRGTVQGHGLLKYSCCPGPWSEPLNNCQTNHLTIGSDDSWTLVSGPASSGP
ncbi:MAG: hypothetical protein ABI876_11360, partial [Bacteroidota bacterium]